MVNAIPVVLPQGPHSQMLMMGGGAEGAPTEVHILYPKKSKLQNLSTQKNHYFFSTPKKSLSPFLATQKTFLCFFLQHKKILASFIDPKKLLWAKISDPRKSLAPPPPSSLKYVSGAPGSFAHAFKLNMPACINQQC